MQLGIPYKLTGPDGTQVVFNSPEDPNFVGYLDQENGITGLLDSADVREGYFDIPEWDGGVQTNNFFSRRVGTIQGLIIPEPNMLTYNQRESALKRASRGMRGLGPSVLTWQPDGRSEMMMYLYRQGKITITGRRPKQFVVPMSSPYAFLMSAAIHSQLVRGEAVTGDPGFSSPIGSPLEVAYNAVGSTGIVNEGDAPSWPEIVLTGPWTNPTIENGTTGRRYTLTCSIAAGESLYINHQNRSVLLKGSESSPSVVNRYSYYARNFSINEWWPLEPGNNNVRVFPGPYSSPTTVTVLWRDAWE